MIDCNCIRNGRLLLGDKIVENKVLLYTTEILAIVDEDAIDGYKIQESLDACGAYISPGFIDLHVHGSGGVDVMDATPQSLEKLSTTLVQTGTTSFLATTMTMSPQAIDQALANIQKEASTVTGAIILGIHLEGPFLNASKHGAQDKNYIQKADFSLIERYVDEIRMITIAPEEEGAKAFIQFCQEHYPHILFSIGHSEATYEQSIESFSWGVSHATHLFNAMPPYHHRQPGVVGAVFDSDVSCDIIADLIHTHPSTLALVAKMKKEKLVLITDAMRAGCMKCGSYDLGGQKVEVHQGKALLEDGTLAGSVLKMNEAIRNICKHSSLSLVEAVYAASGLPAKLLGIQKGQLKVGYDADIVLFDEDLSIITTIVAGEIKYRR